MRIIAGRLGGRNFDAPHGHKTHPMSEKARGGLFNALGDIAGLSVLDAFAGSGALALEAISRGASSATLIESDPSAQKTIINNIASLKLRNISLIKANASAWLTTSSERFDLVLLDPPYDNIQPKLLERLAIRASDGGTIVLSLPPSSDFKLSSDYQLLASKSYGDASLVFYRKT